MEWIIWDEKFKAVKPFEKIFKNWYQCKRNQLYQVVVMESLQILTMNEGQNDIYNFKKNSSFKIKK